MEGERERERRREGEMERMEGGREGGREGGVHSMREPVFATGFPPFPCKPWTCLQPVCPVLLSWQPIRLRYIRTCTHMYFATFVDSGIEHG